MTTLQPDRWRLLVRWLPAVAWMLVIFFLSAQSDLPHPESGWLDLLLSSAAHVGVYSVLAVLWRRVVGERSLAWLVVLGVSGLYALSDEWHQSFVPGRNPDVADLGCDLLGIVLGLLAWHAWRRRSS